MDEIEIEIEIGAVSPVKVVMPPTTTAAATTKEEVAAGKIVLSAAKGAEGIHRAAGKAIDILSPSKMSPYRPLEQGSLLFFSY